MRKPVLAAKPPIANAEAAASGTIGGTIGIGRCTTRIPGITWD
ncbi:hypothetical protein [Sphaerisporangium perillae]|nr:hypothetical protein [Sphaerisporangium perillae]